MSTAEQKAAGDRLALDFTVQDLRSQVIVTYTYHIDTVSERKLVTYE